MKIILTVHQFLPEYFAGTEILTYETAKGLIKQGHDVRVFTGYPSQLALKDSEKFDRYVFDGIPVERFFNDTKPMGNQSNVQELEYNNRLVYTHFKDYLKDEKPDVVHVFHLLRLTASVIDACVDVGVPMVLTPTDFWFLCPNCQLRLPDGRPCLGPDKMSINCLRHFIFSSRSLDINKIFQMTPDWVIVFINLLLKKGINFDNVYSPLARAIVIRKDFLLMRLNRIDRVLVPTQIMMSMLTCHGLNKQRTTFIPFGVNLEYLHHAIRPELNDVLRLGYIGTLSEHKGVHILLEAVRKLEGKPIELKIYGDPDQYPDYVKSLKEIAQDDPRIKFCGTFPNEDIGSILSDIDLLVVPSLWYENTPLVIYSAQGARCPVIASNVPGISEVIKNGENGLLFEAGNASELVSVIKSLLNNQGLLQKLSANAKKPLSTDEYVLKLLEIYKEISQLGPTL